MCRSYFSLSFKRKKNFLRRKLYFVVFLSCDSWSSLKKVECSLLPFSTSSRFTAPGTINLKGTIYIIEEGGVLSTPLQHKVDYTLQICAKENRSNIMMVDQF